MNAENDMTVCSTWSMRANEREQAQRAAVRAHCEASGGADRAKRPMIDMDRAGCRWRQASVCAPQTPERAPSVIPCQHRNVMFRPRSRNRLPLLHLFSGHVHGGDLVSAPSGHNGSEHVPSSKRTIGRGATTLEVRCDELMRSNSKLTSPNAFPSVPTIGVGHWYQLG